MLTKPSDACQLIDQFELRVPGLEFDANAVRFGAAIHDLGKVLVPSEMVGPGNRHEELGPALLKQHGVPSRLARFARTHGRWRGEADLPLEDLIVALADTIWCGRRDLELEERIAGFLPGERWEGVLLLDQIVGPIAERGEERLAWQFSSRSDDST